MNFTGIFNSNMSRNKQMHTMIKHIPFDKSHYVAPIINLNNNYNFNKQKKNVNSTHDRSYDHKMIEKNIQNMKENQYNPSIHDKKILTIIACNTDSLLKLNCMQDNLPYFTFKNNDIILINSVDALYNNELKNNTLGKITKYYEVPNDKTLLDFGKWIYILNNYNCTNYDYIVFSNDSIIINGNINHFFNNMISKSVDLYGYNDSTQIRYHYQSYLFGLKTSKTYILNKLIDDKKHLITDSNSLVHNTEILMTDYFTNNDCFLKIGNISSHKLKNIYFENDTFYNFLFKTGLLPLKKIKRMIL
jgi:hypothetical protein